MLVVLVIVRGAGRIAATSNHIENGLLSAECAAHRKREREKIAVMRKIECKNDGDEASKEIRMSVLISFFSLRLEDEEEEMKEGRGRRRRMKKGGRRRRERERGRRAGGWVRRRASKTSTSCFFWSLNISDQWPPCTWR